MEKNFIKDFEKHLNKNKLNKFYEYLQKNNLIDKFILEATWYNPYTNKYNSDLLEKNLSNFTIKILKDKVSQKYGNDLSNKFCEYIYNRDRESIKRHDLFVLDSILKNGDYTNLENLEKVFDLACDKNNILGTHITRENLGDKLSNEGVLLSGHKFAANDLTRNNYQNNVRLVLEENITFFDDQPFDLLFNLSGGRNYKNYQKSETKDVMLISIPPQSLNDNAQGIIINKNQNLYLNPEYVQGYTKINTLSGNIESINQNPKFVQRIPKTSRKMNNDFEYNLESWYNDASTSKFKKFSNKIKSIFSRNKNLKLNSPYNQINPNNNFQPTENNFQDTLSNQVNDNYYDNNYYTKDYDYPQNRDIQNYDDKLKY